MQLYCNSLNCLDLQATNLFIFMLIFWLNYMWTQAIVVQTYIHVLAPAQINCAYLNSVRSQQVSMLVSTWQISWKHMECVLQGLPAPEKWPKSKFSLCLGVMMSKFLILSPSFFAFSCQALQKLSQISRNSQKLCVFFSHFSRLSPPYV